MPLSSASPQTLRARSGWNRNGSQPSAYSAVASTFFGPSDAIQIGTDGRSGFVEQLERLAEPGALPLGQRQREDAVVPQRLAAQAAADQVDDLAGAAERLVVRHSVEALDHLRPARPEAEDRPALRDVVESGRGLQDRAGRARVDVEDRRPDLDRLGLGGEVPHQGGGVEAVGLRHPQRVQPRLLERDHLVGRLPGVAGVHQLRGELHASDCDRTAVTVARTAILVRWPPISTCS